MITDQELLNAKPLPYRIYPGKRIVVTIGGQKTLLRCTVDQFRRYQALSRQRVDRTLPKETEEILEVVRLDRYAILEIAFNPSPDKVDFTREELEKGLDHNHAGHLAGMWIQELLHPELDPRDPILAPVAG